MAGLAEQQLSTSAQAVAKASKRAAAAQAAADAARAATKLEKLTPVPRELLDRDNEVDASIFADWQLRSEAARKRKRADAQKPLEIEVSRHKAVTQLAASFSRLAAERLGKKWFTHFEAWLFARREICGTDGADSILPTGLAGEITGADAELIRKLTAAGEPPASAEAMCVELSKLPKRLAARIVRPPPGAAHVRVAPLTGGAGRVAKLRLTCLGTSVEVNRSHYDKLRLLYAATNAGAAAADATAFTRAAMVLLLRYSSLQGTHYRGGGYQAAVHGEVFDALKAGFDTRMECFASPLNCRWRRFCSMFLDTDAPFGSLGSFFAFRPTSGSFEANPPFDKAFVSRMAKHMFSLLASTEEPLMFVVIIPAWTSDKCWKMLAQSSFMQHHTLLDAGKHGYFEGAQHNRANRYRVASTGTSLFYLQNAAARAKWPVTGAKIAAVARAFAPHPESGANTAQPPRRRSAADAAAGSDALIGGTFDAPADGLSDGSRAAGPTDDVAASDRAADSSSGPEEPASASDSGSLGFSDDEGQDWAGMQPSAPAGDPSTDGPRGPVADGTIDTRLLTHGTARCASVKSTTAVRNRDAALHAQFGETQAQASQRGNIRKPESGSSAAVPTPIQSSVSKRARHPERRAVKDVPAEVKSSRKKAKRLGSGTGKFADDSAMQSVLGALLRDEALSYRGAGAGAGASQPAARHVGGLGTSEDTGARPGKHDSEGPPVKRTARGQAGNGKRSSFADRAGDSERAQQVVTGCVNAAAEPLGVVDFAMSKSQQRKQMLKRAKRQRHIAGGPKARVMDRFESGARGNRPGGAKPKRARSSPEDAWSDQDPDV